jgi:phospholipase/carboxylesterase
MFINRILLLALIFGFVISSTSCQQHSTKPTFVYEVRQTAVPKSKQKLLLLLHGLGSNEKDLFSLAQFIPSNYTVISVRVPHKFNDGYAWYNVDFSSNPRTINTVQAKQSRDELISFIDQMCEMYDVKKNRVVVSGFSQGAIMSYSIVLSSPDLKAMASFGGRILEESLAGLGKNQKFGDLNCFIAHGTKDQMIQIQDARIARETMAKIGAIVSYHEYQDGHTINEDMLSDFVPWLQSIHK